MLCSCNGPGFIQTRLGKWDFVILINKQRREFTGAVVFTELTEPRPASPPGSTPLTCISYTHLVCSGDVEGQRTEEVVLRCFQGFVDLGWTHLSGPDQAELQDSGSEEEVSFTENRAQVSLMTTLHLTEAAEQPNPGRLPAQRPGPEPELTDESDHLHRRTRRMPGRYCSVLLAAEHEFR